MISVNLPTEVAYVGTSTTSTFDVVFPVFSKVEAEVTITEPDGDIVALVVDIDYSITITRAGVAASLSFISSPRTYLVTGKLKQDYTLTIKRGTTFIQPVKFSTPLSPDAIERNFDRLTVSLISLRETLAQVVIPPAPPAPLFVHYQTTALSVWTVNHNLGMMPSVELWNSGGQFFEAEVLHTSDNRFLVILNTAITGTARCN